MKKLVTRSLAVLALLLALIVPAHADFSKRGIFEGDLNGGGKIVFFVSNNITLSAYVFDVAGAQVSSGNGGINLSDGSFSISLSSGTTLTGNVSRTSVTTTYNGRSITATRTDSFGRCDSIAGLFNGTATGNDGSTLTSATFIIDSAGNIFFLANQNGTEIGGFGTATITHHGDDDAAPNDEDEGNGGTTGTFSITLVSGPTMTGTFTFQHGRFTATFTLNGVQYTFTADRDSLDNRLANISTRGFVGTGQEQLIGGFIITGGPKLVLIRALGPSLSNAGVSPVLANPKLQLFQGSTLLATNDDWQTNSNASDITATGIPPSNPLEAALLVRLEPGAYTTIVTGSDGGTGIALVEVYEADKD